MHPTVKKVLDEVTGRVERNLTDLAFGDLASLPLRVSPYVPARKTRKEWQPPEGGRFTGYGPEDEAWMRPLGLGTVVEVDLGPQVFEIRFPKHWADWKFPVMPWFTS